MSFASKYVLVDETVGKKKKSTVIEWIVYQQSVRST